LACYPKAALTHQDERRVLSMVGMSHDLSRPVRAQLIDAETGSHLWADRFERDTGDLFTVQNEITSRLANTLGAEAQ